MIVVEELEGFSDEDAEDAASTDCEEDAEVDDAMVEFGPYEMADVGDGNSDDENTEEVTT